MLLIKSWVLLPALLAALSLGCGLLVERLSGARLPGVLLVPVGLAGIIVLARAAMWLDATAELATPLVALAAVAGLVLGRARLRPREVDRWAVAAAAAVFAMFAAPVVLGGSATFAGYTVLGDTAVHFVLVDRIASHGTDLAGLAPSSYRQTLESYLGSGYPLGAHAALGAARPLAFVDVAWAFQPFLAFVAAALALTLIGLLRGIMRPGWRPAAVAALAAQPALVYGYALQGSIKEHVTLWLIPLLVALVVALDSVEEERHGIRHVVPLAVVSAAGIAAIGLAVAAWLGPILLAGLWVVVRRRPRQPVRIAAIAAAFAGMFLVLSIPTLLDLGDYLEVTRQVVTTQTELGNLVGPLPLFEVFGVWLTGDYRFLPATGTGLDALELTYAAVGLVAVAGLFGLAWLVRRRSLGPLLFLGTSLLALWYVTRSGSPWADGKALAIASPAVLLMAALGPIALESLGARVEGMVLGLLLAAGVLASNALAYHDVSLAPRERMQELADLGERTAGRGPLLYTEFEEFGKHFLREADPTGASEAFYVPGRTPGLASGGRPSFAEPTNASDLAPADLARFELLVQRRTPEGGPPAPGWSRTWSGRYYELWQRGGGSPPAAAARPTTRLTPAMRPLPRGWSARAGTDPPLVQTVGPGEVAGTITVPRSQEYDVWLSGSFGREVSVSLDGRRVGGVRDELVQPAGWIEIGRARVEAGRHRVLLTRAGGSLRPGNGDGLRTLGPLVLVPRGG